MIIENEQEFLAYAETRAARLWGALWKANGGQSKEQGNEIFDSVSLAWQRWRMHPEKPAGHIVRWACYGVMFHRHFQESKRSATHPENTPMRLHESASLWAIVNGLEVKDDSHDACDIAKFFSRGNPATLGRIQLDLAEFFTQLTRTQRDVLTAYLVGESTTDIAARYGKSLPWPCWVRARCHARWRLFMFDRRGALNHWREFVDSHWNEVFGRSSSC